jgi:hypothetical protein
MFDIRNLVMANVMAVLEALGTYYQTHTLASAGWLLVLLIMLALFGFWPFVLTAIAIVAFIAWSPKALR